LPPRLARLLVSLRLSLFWLQLGRLLIGDKNHEEDQNQQRGGTVPQGQGAAFRANCGHGPCPRNPVLFKLDASRRMTCMDGRKRLKNTGPIRIRPSEECSECGFAKVDAKRSSSLALIDVERLLSSMSSRRSPLNRARAAVRRQICACAWTGPTRSACAYET